MSLFARPVVGLDVGTSSAKAVVLTKKGGRYELTAAAVAEFPREALQNMNPEVQGALKAETLKKLFKQAGLKSRKVTTSLAGDAVIPRYIRLPAMSAEELRRNIATEAEQYIPLNLDQVVLDFQILNEVEEEGQKKIEVLLVAAKNDQVDLHLGLLRKAGLTPQIIDVDAFALQNAYEVSRPGGETETVALLNVGASLTTLNILEAGQTRFTRDISVAGNDFTKEIQKEFNLNFGEAEEFKRARGAISIEEEDIGLSVVPETDDRVLRMSDAIMPVLNKLLGEVRRSFDFYETQARKKTVERIVLSGGSARLKNLNRFLASKLGIPVEPLNAFRNFEVGKGLDSEELAEKEPQLAVGVGLALRKVG